ncbi:unnamed protein product [Heligmosomoides polygyrus]|uniref:G protein-coupled receptor n=1 Tax=Heligmosomoides polygyrus TaxID=6339 RepID=A0A3P8CZK4_HELPZ|nr:unnamed protein product [Heligmosomoides polygyrus]
MLFAIFITVSQIYLFYFIVRLFHFIYTGDAKNGCFAHFHCLLKLQIATLVRKVRLTWEVQKIYLAAEKKGERFVQQSADVIEHLQKSGDAFDKAQSITLLIGTLSVIAVLVTSMGVMMFCSRGIFVAVANRLARPGTYICRVPMFLTFQAALPFVFLHLPFYISVVAPLFGARTGEASNYFPFLFAWCPALNPLIAFYFVRDLRTFVLSWFGRNSTTLQGSNTIVFAVNAR